MPEPENESAISIAEAARLPEYVLDGAAAAFTTVRSHMTRGVLTKAGSRVYLESWRRGGRVVTSRAAVARFHARLTHGGTPADQLTPSQTKHAHERADRRLAAAGI